MAPITRSRSRAVGQFGKYVLENPPVLFTLANILKDRGLYNESCNLKLVFKSEVTNEIINNSLADKRYEYDYACAMKRRTKRFEQTVSRYFSLINTSPKRRLRIKYLFECFEYIVDNKDIVDLREFKSFKKAMSDKLKQMSTDPEISERINRILCNHDWSVV